MIMIKINERERGWGQRRERGTVFFSCLGEEVRLMMIIPEVKFGQL